ncbi:MAG: nucleotidyltransferase family protein [Acidimicrobiales bacterium]
MTDMGVVAATGSGRTAGALLAAGGGSRFRGPDHKLLADLEGRPLLDHALAPLMAAGLDHVGVVTGSVDLTLLLPREVSALTNDRWAEGQATSLRVAVDWARSLGVTALVVGLGDQPGILASAWRNVAEAATSPIAVATYRGKRGHPVRLHSSMWDLLPTDGDRGAGVVMTRFPELVCEVACDGDTSDVDTVEDLARWR